MSVLLSELDNTNLGKKIFDSNSSLITREMISWGWRKSMEEKGNAFYLLAKRDATSFLAGLGRYYPSLTISRGSRCVYREGE